MNIKKLLIPFAIMGAMAANIASAELTVVTVSMEKLFDDYHKSEDAESRLESIREQAVQEAQEREQSLQEEMQSLQEMQEDMDNPMLSDDAKSTKQQELQQRIQELRQKQAEAQQWQQQTANEIQRQNQEVRGELIDEIVKVVNDIALKQHNADIVFDTSDILGSGVPTVLYADSSLDITDKVLKELNKDAPNN